jgi:hypothetical protein
MTGLLCDPVQEQEALYRAIDTLHRQWGRSQMAKSYTNLHTAIARAERALSVLEPCQDKRGIAFKVYVLGLACMAMVAREEISERSGLP